MRESTSGFSLAHNQPYLFEERCSNPGGTLNGPLDPTPLAVLPVAPNGEKGVAVARSGALDEAC